jgi:L-ascorbate metabolism protein UlaG (beta-lactamase superfamily)
MSSDSVFLKPNAVVEPLLNQWYAWAYLLAPQSSAMFLANTHLKLMQSFAVSPQIHVNALKNPAMRGGPFLELPAERAPEVKELFERTSREVAHLVELAEAIKALDRILTEEAKGNSLEPLYAKVPEPLKGYVELVYDLKDNPTIRFFEGLLYKSRYYDTRRQSVCIHTVNPDARTFVLSTPRLRQEGDVFADVPFTSEALDELYRMRSHAGSFGHVREALGVPERDADLLRSFFTTEAPRFAPRFEGTEPRVRYFGHATVLVESPGVNILFDPVVSYNHEGCPPRLSHADLPATIDYVVLTHNHQDHFLVETMLELRQRVRAVVVPKSAGGTLIDPSLKLILQQIGVRQVIELDDMEALRVEGGTITALPFLGEHSDLDIRTKAGFFVELRGKKLMMMADANNIEPRLYDHVHAHTGDADILFVGMECDGAPMSWLYGPLLLKPPVRKNDMARRLDGSDAAKAMRLVDQFHPKQVYIYAMGQEPWLGHVSNIVYTEKSHPIIESNKVLEACRSRGAVAERLYLTREIGF